MPRRHLNPSRTVSTFSTPRPSLLALTAKTHGLDAARHPRLVRHIATKGKWPNLIYWGNTAPLKPGGWGDKLLAAVDGDLTRLRAVTLTPRSRSLGRDIPAGRVLDVVKAVFQRDYAPELGVWSVEFDPFVCWHGHGLMTAQDAARLAALPEVDVLAREISTLSDLRRWVRYMTKGGKKERVLTERSADYAEYMLSVLDGLPPTRQHLNVTTGEVLDAPRRRLPGRILTAGLDGGAPFIVRQLKSTHSHNSLDAHPDGLSADNHTKKPQPSARGKAQPGPSAKAKAKVGTPHKGSKKTKSKQNLLTKNVVFAGPRSGARALRPPGEGITAPPANGPDTAPNTRPVARDDVQPPHPPPGPLPRCNTPHLIPRSLRPARHFLHLPDWQPVNKTATASPKKRSNKAK